METFYSNDMSHGVILAERYFVGELKLLVVLVNGQTVANNGVVRLSDRCFASRANFLLFLDRLERLVCLLEGLDLEPGELVQLPLFDEFRIRFLECRGGSPS